MPSNPMQRKVRNSYLFGILTMLLISIIIGVIVFLLVIKPEMDAKKAEEQIIYVEACRLTTDVNSGDEISAAVVQTVTVPQTEAPTDYITMIDLTEGTKIAKVDLTMGTVLSEGLIVNDESELDNSLRLIEYNMLTLPIAINIGDYIDIRLTFPNGQDLIVVSKKEVQDIRDNTVSLNLTESEILMMNSAIVEAYIMPSSNLYVVQYSDPGMQTAAIPTYVPTVEVQNLIKVDSNITSEARTYLESRFIPGLRDGYINTQINQYGDERLINIESGIQEQIEKAIQAREDYLTELSGY